MSINIVVKGSGKAKRYYVHTASGKLKGIVNCAAAMASEESVYWSGIQTMSLVWKQLTYQEQTKYINRVKEIK